MVRFALLVLILGCAAQPVPDGSGDVVFTDVTQNTGIDFVSVGGKKSNFVLDLMGAGAILFDHDGDGDLDFYGITGSALEGFGDQEPPRNTLYENQGNGTFRDVTKTAGVGDSLWGAGSCFFDHDGDGDLDLYVVNYLEAKYRPGDGVSLAAKLGLRFPALPHEFQGQDNVLYRNEGDGTFTDVTEEAGARDHGGKGLGCVALDYDNDGDMDLYIANDTTRNTLLQNQGDGTFVDVGLLCGASYDGDGSPQGSMGVAAGDADGDGWMDIAVTNFAHEGHTLYLNQRDGTFIDASVPAGLIPETVGRVGWGVQFFDYDHDGDQDLFFSHGHLLGDMTMGIIRTITPDDYLPGTMTTDAFEGGYAQGNRLFRNVGAAVFEEVTDRAGPAFQSEEVSRGAAFGDIDGDGDIDIVVVNKNEQAKVFRNEGAERRGWILVSLRGTHCNRSAIGARVEIWAGERRQMREVTAGSSYCGQNGLDVHFGLGEAAGIDRIRVRWPCGKVQEVQEPPTRARVVIEESTPGPG